MKTRYISSRDLCNINKSQPNKFQKMTNGKYRTGNPLTSEESVIESSVYLIPLA